MPATNDNQQTVAVIGGGLGGLACAVRLAHAGYRVVVFEKNESLGGKLGEIRDAGFTWDTGATMLTAPHVLRGLFVDVDRRPDDYLALVRLDTTCRHRWADGTVLDEDAAFWQRTDVERFLEHARDIYEAAGEFFIHNDIGHWWSRLRPEFFDKLRHLPKIITRLSMHDVARRHFSDPHLVQVFDRFAAWTASSPFKAPAALSVLPYLLAKFGGWHVQGGLRQVIAALVRLAGEFGVEFRMNTEITGLHRSRKGFSVAVEGAWQEFDLVVCNQDAVQAYQALMPRDPAARFRKTFLERVALSHSTLVICLGVTKKFDGLAHLNVIHSADTRQEYHELFSKRVPAADPTISICASSRAEPGRAPQGCDNWVVQLAAPATRTSFDWKQNAGACVERVLEKIERAGFPGLRKHIVVRHVITPADIRARFNCYLGSIHGFASHSLMTAFRRMRMDPPEVPGFYFVGASTHPGGLVPLVLSSAKNAARKIIGGEEPR